jgi:hypothetical protein
MANNNGVHEGEWKTVGSNNSGNEGCLHEETITGEHGGSPMQFAAESQENEDNRGRSNDNGINNTSKYDGMQSYNAKI